MRIEVPEAFSGLFIPKRFKVYYGGRGGGKSENIGRALLIAGMQEKQGILCAREFQKSIKDSVHRLLKEITDADPVFSRFYRVTNNEIVGNNGTFFIFMGLRHNIEEIKSTKGIKKCWVEEAHAVSERSWELLIPTIREPDSEIWVSFNPKNPTDPTWQNMVLSADDDFIVKQVNWNDNKFFPDVLNKERLRLLKKDPVAYKHVWDGEFDTRYSGAVYAKFVNQAQIKQLSYDPERPLNTAWDMGYDDETAVVFYQVAKNEITVIDGYSSNFEDIRHYCEMLYGRRIVVDQRDADTGAVTAWHFGEDFEGGAHRKQYNYASGRHWVPHDAGYKLQAAGGRSIVEQAMEFGVKLLVLPATGQQTSEQALRKALPDTWFDRDKCKDVIHSLMSYHYEYDEDLKIYSKEPVHDWSSHFCDSLEVMARVWQNPPQATPTPPPKWDIRADEQGRIQAGFSISDYLKDQENARNAD